jgi:uncharacterized protein YbjT (DUF2867 family)
MIVVTGATGNVGLEVVRALSAGGHSVRAAVREPLPLDLPHVTPVAFDFADPASYDRALAGATALFLMRPPAISDTKRFINPVIDAARRANVQRVVFLSLLGAERNRIVPHAAVEAYLQTAGVPWTLLRAGFFMQNLNTTHRDEIRDRSEILVPAGRGKTSFIDVRDIAAVAAKALTEPGHTGRAYPLTGSEALDYYQVAAMLSEALGRPIVYRNPSLWAFIRHWRGRKLPLSFILVMAGIYTTTRLGLAATITPDVPRLLGRPPITMRQFATDYTHDWLS